MSEIRGFDPSKVERRHISPKTLLYGGDAPGIKLRLDRFEEILRDGDEEPSVYANTADAIGYISSGDMFSDAICVIVKDATDALKSSAESKRLSKALTQAISTYGDDSTIIIAAPVQKDTSALSSLIKSMESMGATVREVSAPQSSQARRWLDEYSKTLALSLTDEDKDKLLELTGGDAQGLRDAIDVIGNEIPNLSIEEMAEWLDKSQEIRASDIRAAIASKDANALSSIIGSFGTGDTAYRTALVKMRSACLELLICSADGGAADALIAYKKALYPSSNPNSAYYSAKDASASDLGFYISLYQEINRQLSYLATSREAKPEDVLGVLIRH